MSRDSSPMPSSDDSAVGSAVSSCLTNGSVPVPDTTTRSAVDQRWRMNQQTSTSSTTSTTATKDFSRPSNYQNVSARVSQTSNNHNSPRNSIDSSQSDVPINNQSNHRVKLTRPTARDLVVDQDELAQAAKQMRTSNVSLISRSIRTVLSCFDDLDLHKFEPRTNYLVNFKSNGINNCANSVLRPVSILWPDNYDKMAEQLSVLDTFLLNTEFREKPVDWMLKRGLTQVPNCSQCKEKMSLKYENNTARWQCQKKQACLNYFMPVLRPSFFSRYENVSLDKLLFSIYYWSTCTPGEELQPQMNIRPDVLNGIWTRIQNVCRTSLERSYPRHRLTNNMDPTDQAQANDRIEPIDLISIKLNELFVVCAKHPKSNLVRLGIYIPNVSLYTFTELVESWFAHGTHVRICESKFLELSKKRSDIKLTMVSRLDMISRGGQYSRDSAFGYLICQLTHVFKDYDSSTLSCEGLKLLLSELQWRELYGTTPYDAFTNIVSHMAQYGPASEWYSEPVIAANLKDSLEESAANVEVSGTNYIWAERYFYATVDPVDAKGKVISKYSEPKTGEEPPEPDVRIRCHDCNLLFESFDFSIHIIAHVEHNRREHERKEYSKRKIIECKHCFKTLPSEQLAIHSGLLRTHYQQVSFGCRICCIKMNDRSSYLHHMRRYHYESETPYHCPKCRFASSFQRDVFIHFQEEHRHSLVVLCPLCLRSFTVAKPEVMTIAKMKDLSKLVYQHISHHYSISKSYSCNNCCLCFLDRDGLIQHQQKHHNPLVTNHGPGVKVHPFVVDRREEEYCVRALPMELFIANKRPNMALSPTGEPSPTKGVRKKVVHRREELTVPHSTSVPGDETKQLREHYSNSEDEQGSDTDSDSYRKVFENGTIYVRGLEQADKFLDGGRPSLSVQKGRTLPTARFSSAGASNSRAKENSQLETIDRNSCSSQKLIDYLSKMKRADGVVANQSVVLTPRETPAKCCECQQFITVDHFVAQIVCIRCKYLTHCPRAATKHNMMKHTDAEHPRTNDQN